ncbi:heavy metal translocating P-type ATPase [Streptomyces caniscabiei]|uniref:heavy metal translocating P-type ATPase n=1 Tax=Streptomyces caniscabiei TaxID=2746961 RepID=UPI0029B8119F|nr:heavy metal translocating P-type ATPase [Streptomyces caniscabiei]MDX2775788.1 heavy metal translocating P-type ATPase [Streptomyces caniscabiei]
MFKRKFWLSLALTLPTLAFSPTVQSWFGVDWAFGGSEYIPAIFGVIIFFYGGMVFLKGAGAELAAKQPGMMTLISMAITVAFGYSLASTFRLVSGMDFWWELATLVTIMLLGHWLEMASVQSAQGALKELAKLLPDEAERMTGNSTEKVPTADLKVGDLVLVRPGAQVPVDGIVTKGGSEVNESMLTGESKPVKKSERSAVIGGTINGNGALTIKVTKIGDETTLAGIMKLVAEAEGSKSKTQILADKAAFYLTFVALGAAVITGVTWTVLGASAEFVLERIVTVLVIACPHALGLAIPLVTAISTTKAARNGLLVRRRMALEAARNVDVILFDKTGTLTKGEQGVVEVVAPAGREIFLAWVAAVEYESEHPIARAIVHAVKEDGIPVKDASGFSALSGRGAQAMIDGTTHYVGGARLVEQLDAAIPEGIKQAERRASSEGKTTVYGIVDGEVVGAIMLADVIRDESKEAVMALRMMGKRVAMLTGDGTGVAAWVAKELGITEYFAEVLPQHKAETVKKLQADGSRVAMVGDGVNDAPALTQADIGIAIGAGTDVAIESAGIVLASSDPRGVAKVVTLSKATYRKMVQNLAWATGYNVVAIPLAAGITATFGFVLSPALGAVLMSVSTIIVAVNAQFLRNVKL